MPKNWPWPRRLLRPESRRPAWARVARKLRRARACRVGPPGCPALLPLELAGLDPRQESREGGLGEGLVTRLWALAVPQADTGGEPGDLHAVVALHLATAALAPCWCAHA